MNKEVRYIHQESVHNFVAPKEVVPVIIDLLNPKSVIDVGCGTGTWLKIFQDLGIQEVLGIDGEYVDLSLLKIEKHLFQAFDLEKELNLNKKFDLAISLEVAEHLKFESSDIFVKTLCDLSETIIFSAAITNQGGQNHINEQNPEFWIKKFQENGFELFDVLRPIFWDNNKVDFWYRQNMFVFSKDISIKNKLSTLESFKGKHLVHPLGFQGRDLIAQRFLKENEKIVGGNKNFKFYFKLFFMFFKNKF